jgi:hypothetical protein
MRSHGDWSRGPQSKPPQQKVAAKAYAIYLAEGRPERHEKQNWSDAEAQLQQPAAALPMK